MLDVVVTADVLVAAATRIDPDLVQFPTVPPATGADAYDVLGVFNYPGDRHFSLILSEVILETVLVALRETGWGFTQRDRFAAELGKVADQTGGGFVTESGTPVPGTVGPAAAQAMRCAASPDLGYEREIVIVTGDPQALTASGWEPQVAGWPTGKTIMVISPGRFRDLAEQVRLRLRRLP